MYALSFYRSKMILDHPNCFGRLQIVLVRSKLFWSGPNHFGQVQIRLLWTNFYNLDPTKMIWTRPNRIGPNQNELVQNNFGPIEGQGITHLSHPEATLFSKKYFQQPLVTSICA
jgi:hypothetical protein